MEKSHFLVLMLAVLQVADSGVCIFLYFSHCRKALDVIAAGILLSARILSWATVLCVLKENLPDAIFSERSARLLNRHSVQKRLEALAEVGAWLDEESQWSMANDLVSSNSSAQDLGEECAALSLDLHPADGRVVPICMHSYPRVTPLTVARDVQFAPFSGPRGSNGSISICWAMDNQ
ncbi:hypothetical protein NA57DRAFT_52706 [Rhizodiscina lignyota]|uniref:Uncharacterized protein n=1 Tax=Rhizodiscina lignyota TaxID=1504668 RepID=A0A9P4IKD5_9PEZI|nr:hypothetical protein NA57DRAFT_52706 [Rhizodiscina lignyota]